jgi:DNA repair exonuclease SbcCD ATPase subunit
MEEIDNLRKEIENLKEQLGIKNNELKKLDHLQDQLKVKDEQLRTKDDLINNLKNTVKLLEDQIKTLKDSYALKNEQVKTLDSSLKIKDEKIQTLEKSAELKGKEISVLLDSRVDKKLLEDKEKEISSLNEKLEILKGELTKADEDLEMLEQDNEKLRNQIAVASGSKIIDWTNIDIPKSKILAKMKEILMNALHNVTIAVPNIKDLQALTLYEVRSSVNMKISCYIDPGLEEDAELLEEFESLDNISIRMYEGEDRYILDRDGEELLFAVIGNSDQNHLAVHTKDSKHLKFFKSIVMEGWLRSRKIE